tara:strand:- start:4774 stop:5913 length:1140 start_codon:yes stop_codon:yes gene_type:complete
MHYFTFAEKDTTLYEKSGSLNSGLDEILEVRKDVSTSGEVISVSRIMIKFDLDPISKLKNQNVIKDNAQYFLNLFDARPTALATSQSLYAYPVSQSWTMGDGRSYDDPVTTEGCSWNFRHGETDGKLWSEETASGGSWFTNNDGAYEMSHSFGVKSSDMRMDVTGIVNAWLDGTIPNEGFIVKRSGSFYNPTTTSGSFGNNDSGSDEGNSTRFGNFSFFSSDTHTKYPPTLEAVWDDSKWTTGSLSPLTKGNIEDMVIYMKGLRPEYKEKSIAKFRVVGRERFPEKTYSTTSDNLSVKYLPSGSSFYSILDAETDDVVVPFGSGSKLSCDSDGNYFLLRMDGYQPERYYKIEYRIQSGSTTDEETDQYFDEGFTFKVTL